MKVDSATNTKRDGWRRMTFVDLEDGRAVEGGAKTLASYELQKAEERAERRRASNDHVEAEVLSSPSSRNDPVKKNAYTTARQGLSEPDLSQQGRGYERDGSRMQETKITFGTLGGSLSNGGTGNSEDGGSGLGFSGGGSCPHLLIDSTGRLGSGHEDDVEQRLRDLPSPASSRRRAAGTSQGASNGSGRGTGGGGGTGGRRCQVQQQSWGAGGEDDVLELLKHMPKVFVNDIMAHRFQRIAFPYAYSLGFLRCRHCACGKVRGCFEARASPRQDPEQALGLPRTRCSRAWPRESKEYSAVP
ncbi:unnamed protein product [Ectocarpus sp. 6 AP-2014]